MKLLPLLVPKMAMYQEVDVKLFITCRLCLDEPGSYQIVPCIMRQINFCFGIGIDPFDGLPQLICKKCKGILTECYATKKIFLEKQTKLHNKPPKDNNDAQTLILPRTEDVKSPSAADVTPYGNAELAVLADLACDGNSEKSVGATDVCPPGNSVNPAGAVDVALNSKAETRRSSWKKAFTRHFACTICNKSFLTEKSVKRHSSVHKNIISKHDKLFKNYLTVWLNKIDEKKNSTGCLQNVVYNKDKIICARRTSKYHSLYLKKGFFTTSDETDENESEPVKRPMVLSDSSDEKIMKGKKRKYRRLFSSSSTETVGLEENKDPFMLGNKDQQSNPNGMVVINTDYINLDETSSDCPKTNSKKPLLPKHQQLKAADYKDIQNIVTMCHKNHIKKAQTNTDAVLSLGRKVINKQGFSCTGLLRYMEHKDLDVTWKPASNEMQKKGSNFVRIMTKLKSCEVSENDDASWKNSRDITFCRDGGVEASQAPARETCRSEDEPPLPPALSDGATCESNDSNYGNKLLKKTCRIEDEPPLPPALSDGATCESNNSNYGNKLLKKTCRSEDELPLPPALSDGATCKSNNSNYGNKLLNTTCRSEDELPLPPALSDGATCESNDSNYGNKPLNKTYRSEDEPPFPPTLSDGATCESNDSNYGNKLLKKTCRIEDEPPLPPALSDGATCESNDSNYGNKLLDKTPVANPKQLPKKNLPETKPVLIKTNDATLVSPNLIGNALEDADIDDSNMCPPIITSTTSLSVPVSEKENQVPVLEKPTPRIKVKPASELMPARVLNNQETVEGVWKFNPIQSSFSHHLTNTAIAVEAPMTESHSGFVSSQSLNYTRPQIGESNRKDIPHRNQETFITLDSPQLPNTKTRAPFQHFGEILLMSGLKLLDLNEKIPPHFHCLIKFKPILRQSTKAAIGVLLSLFCSEDTFCFNITDTNSKMFDPNQLSAFWQWELLKMYIKGDVVDRILRTTMNAGKDVQENTKLFLYLLKSINLSKDSS